MQPASSNGESSLDAPRVSGLASSNGELALNSGVARCSGDIAMHWCRSQSGDLGSDGAGAAETRAAG